MAVVDDKGFAKEQMMDSSQFTQAFDINKTIDIVEEPTMV